MYAVACIVWSVLHGVYCRAYLSGTFRTCQLRGLWHFSAFSTSFASMCKHVITWGGGGGGMCILFEICKKTPFQKCMGWGGVTFFSVAQHIGRCTQTWHCTVHPFLFRITVIVSIPFFRQGWDPIRADIPLFVDRDIFLQFLPILQPTCLHWHPTFVNGHGPQAIGCEVHEGCCESAVRGFLACLAGCRVTFLQVSPPECALLRTKGFCGASGEATARGVNLYVDMVAAC